MFVKLVHLVDLLQYKAVEKFSMSSKALLLCNTLGVVHQIETDQINFSHVVLGSG